MPKSRFQIAKNDIIQYFNNSDTRVYTEKELSIILGSQRRSWRLTQSLLTSQFIELLIKYANLRAHKFHFPNRSVTRYSWGEIPTYQLALSIERNSYLSHYSALYIHNLTDQIPKRIYVTYEQPEKEKGNSSLKQRAIDEAFSNPVRTSKNISKFSDFTICLLNGQFTSRLGIVEVETEEYGNIAVTGIERTLIDIVVRSVYSGGIYEILAAYKKAKNDVSINKLAAMLTKLNFMYPYHQSIGFFLEKSGVYGETQIKLLNKFNYKFDFYLTHEMKNTEYSKKWRIYYPKGF